MHFWLLCSSRAMKNWSYLTLILQKCFFHMELALIVGVFYQNWRILPCNIKHLKVTIVVSWRYIKKTQFSWIETVHHAMHFQLLPWQMLAPSSQACKEIVFGLWAYILLWSGVDSDDLLGVAVFDRFVRGAITERAIMLLSCSPWSRYRQTLKHTIKLIQHSYI